MTRRATALSTYLGRNRQATAKAKQTKCSEHVYQQQEAGRGAGSWRCIHCGHIGTPPEGSVTI